MEGISRLFCRCRILISQLHQRKTQLCFQRSFKTKKKSVQTSYLSTDRALDHFDIYHRPVYGDLWPSIRIAMLTAKKTAAVMNNFTGDNSYHGDFLERGANNIILRAAARQEQLSEISKDFKDTVDGTMHSVSEVDGSRTYVRQKDESGQTDGEDRPVRNQSKRTAEDEIDCNSDTHNRITSEFDEEDRKDLDRTNLFGFVPTKVVYSETHMMRMEEAEKSMYTPMDIRIDVVKSGKLSLPQDLQVLAFPKGDISEFAQPKVDRPGGLLCFYMMDAASVLPVIALDLQAGDSVLDLCAAPGGKSLSMLQTNKIGNLTCNDLSGSRVARLLNILQYYIPEKDREQVTVTRKSGLFYTEPDYDKVLVDVPCNTDRHMLLVNDNNLFSPSRIKERLELPTKQRDLLVSGIKSCRPGGSVVYSTCTLSPAQNDGIIQQTFDHIWRHTNIDIVVEDLTEMTDIFKDTFIFFKKCRFGQLVIPSLSANFGPMYFCKIKRIK